MAPTIDFTKPLPFFHDDASERVLYIAHGPSPSPLWVLKNAHDIDLSDEPANSVALPTPHGAA